MAQELPRIKTEKGDKEYFLDCRLMQLRNVNDPNDFHEIDEMTATYLLNDYYRQRIINSKKQKNEK